MDPFLIWLDLAPVFPEPPHAPPDDDIGQPDQMSSESIQNLLRSL
jgi:hypothetical protein